MKNSKWLIGLLVIGLLFLAPFRCGKVPPEVRYIEKTDTITVTDTINHRDTIRITEPVPKYVEVLKVDTVFNEKGDTIPLVTENKLYNDTLCYQNDSIILESSITGINPKLDYIKADWRKQEIIKTVTITNYIKRKGFKISPQVGVGYGMINKKPDVFIGVGLSYNF